MLDLLHFGQTSSDREASIPIYERVPFLEITFPSMDSGWSRSRPLVFYQLSLNVELLEKKLFSCLGIIQPHLYLFS